jgi:RND superfamily putative drug exporter
MKRIAYLVTNRSKTVLVVYAAIALLLGAMASGVFSSLATQGYTDPNAESARVASIIAKDFKVTQPDVQIAIDFKSDADAAVNKAHTESLLSAMAQQDGVTSAVSYYSLGSPASLKSTDGQAIYAFLYLDHHKSVEDIGSALAEKFGSQYLGAHLYYSGDAIISHEINASISKDLAKAESFAIPLTFVIQLIVFGSLIASGLPFLISLGAILGTFAVLWLLTLFTDVSVFSINLITGLGIGLGIDYALLIVYRFREELAAGETVKEAASRTVMTAGRTVFFSGSTVALVLLSLLAFPQYFLKSFGYAGVSVVVLAVLGSIFALPALLTLIGHRVNAMRVFKRNLNPHEEGAWFKLTHFVMKRPLLIIVGAVLALLTLAAPIRNITFGSVDERVLPASNKVVVAGQMIRDRFDGFEATPIDVVVESASDISSYAQRISRMHGVTRVQTKDGIYVAGSLVQPVALQGFSTTGAERLSAIMSVERFSAEADTLVSEIRALSSDQTPVLVGGVTATFVDSQAGIKHALPLVFGWIGLVTFVLLFLFTGSVLLPIKALLLNILSLSATLGALTWVFTTGNATWLVGSFINTGTIDTSMIVLIAILAFGLSMDYELFMLSRIKEEHDAGKDTTSAVAFGLQRSGRIVTAAALIISVTFMAFTTSSVTNIKQLGFGTALAILLDASVVRALLVPAFMKVAGKYNWWAPRWAQRFRLQD